MRIKNTFLNTFANLIVLFIRTILLFFTRKIFIDALGMEVLGIDGLLNNILAVLSVAELGIGEAISYSLYKPIKDNDTEKISSIMSFYRKAYKCIGFLVLTIGIIIYYFLECFHKVTINHFTIIYFLYLFNTSFIYFISYKETLIIADQKKYKIAKFETTFILLMYVLQIVVLLITKNYMHYLFIMLLCNFMNRIIANRYISKEYPAISFDSKEKLKTEDINKIKKNVKGLIFHKIGDYLLNGTDNIILSFVSIVLVGIYANYLLLANAVKSFLITIFNAMVPSLGNLVVSESKEVQENTFQMMNFLGFILFGYATICLALLSNSFITLAFGSEYIVSNFIVVLIALNVFLSGLRIINCTIINASGMTFKTRYDSLFQAIINVIVSFILVFQYGLFGVLLGTTISGIVLPNWHTPYIIYRDLFSKKFSIYAKMIVKNSIILLLSGSLCYLLSHLFVVSVSNFIIQVILYFAIFMICLVLFYFKSPQLEYYINIVKKVVKKNERKVN